MKSFLTVVLGLKMEFNLDVFFLRLSILIKITQRKRSTHNDSFP